MDSVRKRMPWLTKEQEEIIRRQLLARAAGHFETAEMWADAAECWADLDQHDRAGALYARAGDLRRAAEAHFAAGDYQTALEHYRQWQASLSTDDLPRQVAALLGQSACLRVMAGRTPSQPPPGRGRSQNLPPSGGERGGVSISQTRRFALEPTGGNEGELSPGLKLFHQARAPIDSAAEPLAAARCQVALAEYGQRLGRFDLVHEGYELALAAYERSERSEQDETRTEQIETARRYLAVVKPYDRLLSQSIEERLAEWGAWDEGPAAPAPAWHRQRDEIESHPFRDGVRDVLHLTTKAQWTAWQALARQEDAPEIDAYLRRLAPEGMIYIPPGPFLMGSPDDDPDANDNEKPQHEVWLAGYYIDRTPVTNVQYREFIEAGGYAQQEYWMEAIEAGRWENGYYNDWIEGNTRQPRFWTDSTWNGDEQPVVGVSWYEALAYARWAGKMLPAEAQWEKAAGWVPAVKKKRIYPWGDDWELAKANSGQQHDRTMPVGRYPDGASAYGLLDMAGNVYEWCSSRWDSSYPYDPTDGREDLSGGDNVGRVLKGGAYYFGEDDAKKYLRCGFRNWGTPRIRYLDWGFRCLTPHAAFPPDSDF